MRRCWSVNSASLLLPCAGVGPSFLSSTVLLPLLFALFRPACPLALRTCLLTHRSPLHAATCLGYSSTISPGAPCWRLPPPIAELHYPLSPSSSLPSTCSSPPATPTIPTTESRLTSNQHCTLCTTFHAAAEAILSEHRLFFTPPTPSAT